MKKQTYVMGAALGLALAAGAARADDIVIYSPTSRVDASTLVHQGPNVQGARVSITNGTITDQGAGPGGTYSASGSVAGVVGDAHIPGGAGDRSFTSTSHGAASLATGTVKASVATTGGEHFGGPGGNVYAMFSDTLYFTNTSGGDLALAFTWAFDGSIASDTSYASSTGASGLELMGCGSCGNLRFAADGAGVGDVAHAHFDDFGVNRFTTFGADLPVYGSGNHWTTAANGPGGAVISTTLLIPAGSSVLGLKAFLDLNCRGGDSCDYGHTGTFSLGALGDGLSYRSASGQFLADRDGGVVPEPGAWALMILGFGLAGGALRRRHALAA